MVEICYYEQLDGSCPFAIWFESLNAEAAAKIAIVIERMSDGNIANAQSVGEGVWERRVNYGPGYRIYFGRDGAKLIVLLTGGTKKRQQADIQFAKRLWAEYKRRKKED